MRGEVCDPFTHPRTLRTTLPAGPVFRRLTRSAALAALLAAAFAVLPPRAPAQTAFSISRWTVNDGLPVNTLLDVFQASDGYLWLATYEGLLRFDGVRFTPLTPHGTGIEGGNIWRIHEDAEGALWAAANGGIVRYHRGEIRTLTAEDGVPRGSVRTVLRDRQGVLWAGTARGLVRQGPDGFVPVLLTGQETEQPTVSALAEDGAGGLWIGTYSEGLFHLRAGRLRRFGVEDGLPHERVNALLRDRDGTVWVGGAGSGVGRLRGDRIETLASPGGPPPLRIQKMAQAPDGAVWLGADNGLFRVRGDLVEQVTGPDGQPLTLITGLDVDRDGGIWISSHRAGLQRLLPASVETVRLVDGVEHDVIYAVAGDGAGGVWIGSRAGLFRRSGEHAAYVPPAAMGTSDLVVRDILRARNGDVWLATFSGLRRLREGRVERFTTAEGLADDLTRTLLETRDGALWVGSFNGLTRYQDGAFRTFEEADGLTDRYVLALHQDRRGDVWVSTQSSGLLRFRNGRFEAPPEVAELENAPVFRIHEDADGTLWIGSTRGLAVLRGGRLRRITQAHGLPSNTVFHLLPDDRGYLWLGTNRGVVRVASADVEAVLAGAAQRVATRLFSRNDGLPSDDVTAVSTPWRAPDGTLWFPTPGGVARIDPASVRENRAPPPVHVEEVRVNGEPLAWTAGLPAGTAPPRLGPGIHRLEIDFTAIGFAAPGQMRFRYRLLGFDEAWVEGGTQRTAVYTNLPPGRYTFRVIAGNEDGVWNVDGATLAFTIRPHFHQTVWFPGVLALLLLGGAVLVYRRGVVRVRRRELEAEREAARQRMQAMLESVTDSFVALDAEWRLTYVNGAGERMLGRPRAELIGRDGLETLAAAAGPAVAEMLRRAASQQRPAVVEVASPTEAGHWLEFRAFPAADGLSVYFGDITGRKEAEETLRSLSMTDALTGLHNRRGLTALAEQRIRVARERHRELHIVFLDLDDMKAVNDRFGHAVGDQALVDTAELMRATFRESDVLARLGGDEFAALVSPGDGVEPARLCERLRAAAHRHNVNAGRPYVLRFSIGTSRFDPENPATLERLLADADRRMYEDKRARADEPAPLSS